MFNYELVDKAKLKAYENIRVISANYNISSDEKILAIESIIDETKIFESVLLKLLDEESLNEQQ